MWGHTSRSVFDGLDFGENPLTAFVRTVGRNERDDFQDVQVNRTSKSLFPGTWSVNKELNVQSLFDTSMRGTRRFR